MEKVLDGILFFLGIGALVYGLRRYRTQKPKPTENKQITREDYLSGNYERELRNRQDQLQHDHRLGVLYIGVGVGLFLSGVYLLGRIGRTELGRAE